MIKETRKKSHKRGIGQQLKSKKGDSFNYSW